MPGGGGSGGQSVDGGSKGFFANRDRSSGFLNAKALERRWYRVDDVIVAGERWSLPFTEFMITCTSKVSKASQNLSRTGLLKAAKKLLRVSFTIRMHFESDIRTSSPTTSSHHPYIECNQGSSPISFANDLSRLRLCHFRCPCMQIVVKEKRRGRAELNQHGGKTNDTGRRYCPFHSA